MTEESGSLRRRDSCFSLHHSVQKSSGTYRVSNPVDTGGSSPGAMCLERGSDYKYLCVVSFSAVFERELCIRIFLTPCAPIHPLAVFSFNHPYITHHEVSFYRVSPTWTPSFIRVFTTTLCCTLSRVRPRQFTTSRPIYVRSSLVLSTLLRLDAPRCISYELRSCVLLFLITHVT